MRALLNPRRVDANAIAQVADGHGLAEGKPVLHIRPQVFENDVSIVHKVLDKLPLKKAAVSILQHHSQGNASGCAKAAVPRRWRCSGCNLSHRLLHDMCQWHGLGGMRTYCTVLYRTTLVANPPAALAAGRNGTG